MMYIEFLNATNCRDNEHNYKVYKNLEVMYMNTDMTKDEIYEYGKKLVDNSKSEKEIIFEEKIKKEIEELKEGLNYERERLELFDRTGNEYMIENCKSWIRHYKRKIKELRWVLENN